jgi:hypothetical protein
MNRRIIDVSFIEVIFEFSTTNIEIYFNASGFCKRIQYNFVSH